MRNTHDLEQALLSAWNTVDDIGLLKDEVQGVIAREAIDAVYWILNARMEKAWDEFETLAAEMRIDDLSLRQGAFPTEEIVNLMRDIAEVDPPAPYRSIYEDEGSLTYKPYRTGQVNPHLSGTQKTITGAGVGEER